MPKHPKTANDTAYSVMREYVDYHNHQECIPFDEFISVVVPAVAQFQPQTLPSAFECQMQADVVRYGCLHFEKISQILSNGKWSKETIGRLSPQPNLYSLTGEWLPYWIEHNLQKVEEEYTDLCGIALHCESLTSTELSKTLKNIQHVNRNLLKNGVDLQKWHAKIERNHNRYSLHYMPYTLIHIFENTPRYNTKMFSALNNPKIMSKAAEVLPPVVVGTLEALRSVLGWGDMASQLPICKFSTTEVKECCNDYKKFAAGVGQHYKNLQLRAKLVHSTIVEQKLPTPKRKL